MWKRKRLRILKTGKVCKIKSRLKQQNLPMTAAWQDWGFRLNLKLVLYLEIL